MGRGLLEGVTAYATQHHLGWQFGLVDMEVDDDSNVPDGVGPPKADALLGVITPKTAERWTADQRRRIVNISRAYSPEGVQSVICDDVAIARMAAEYLMGKKLGHYAYFGTGVERQEAFADAIRAGGGDYVGHAHSRLPRYDRWIANLPPSTGVLTYNDFRAADVVRQLQRAGRRVPDDIAVLGIDDDTLAGLLSPMPLSSVAPNWYGVGLRAAAVLEELLAGRMLPGPPQTVRPLRVVERASSDFPAVNDPIALAAARMIRTQACSGVTVAQIIDALPLSRRPLERRFAAAFGHTMQNAIHRRRIAEACRLLKESDLPIKAIARKCGFNDPKRFTRMFNTLMKCPPSDYRRAHAANGSAET